MRPVVAQLGPFAAASAASLLTAGVVGAGALALTGTTLDVARRLLFTSSANDSGLTFTVIGTDASNNRVTEVVTGALSGSTSRTVLDYKTLTSISSSGASAGTLSIGTALSGGVASTPWVRVDEWALPQIALQAVVSGQVNYSIQSTLDDPNDPNSPVAPASLSWVDSSDTAVVNATTTQQSNFAFSPRYIRALINSYTGVTASVRLTVLQSGVTPV